MDKEDKLAIGCFLMVIACAMMPVELIWHAWVAAKIWQWLIEPSTHVHLSLIVFCGAALIKGCLWQSHIPKQEKSGYAEQIGKLFGELLIGPLLLLGIAYAVMKLVGQ